MHHPESASHHGRRPFFDRATRGLQQVDFVCGYLPVPPVLGGALGCTVVSGVLFGERWVRRELGCWDWWGLIGPVLELFAANSWLRWVVCGEAKREAAPRAGAGQRPGVEDNGGLWAVRRLLSC